MKEKTGSCFWGNVFVLVVAVIAVGLGAPPAHALYSIEESEQSSCYNDSTEMTCPSSGDYYGQDAQYTGLSASFTNNGDGTVTDNVTGLMWVNTTDTNGDGTINSSDKGTFSQAETYCSSLTLADYTDWRVPSNKEMYSLFDARGMDASNASDSSGLTPYIDTTYFAFGWGDTDSGERLIDAQYVTSTENVATTSEFFGVNFADGRIKSYPKESDYYVQCVRGGFYYGDTSYVDNGDNTITDNETNLMWSKYDSGQGYTWKDALALVQTYNSSSFAGYSDWRLPNTKELQSIVDYTRSPDTTSSAAINSIFSTTQITNEAGEADYPYFWTSTSHTGENTTASTTANYIAFGRGLGYDDSRGWYDVHGAGCQRTDPKTGDPDDYPTGRGPQNDAVRIYNYVRIVRGSSVSYSNQGPLTYTAPVFSPMWLLAFGGLVGGVGVWLRRRG